MREPEFIYSSDIDWVVGVVGIIVLVLASIKLDDLKTWIGRVVAAFVVIPGIGCGIFACLYVTQDLRMERYAKILQSREDRRELVALAEIYRHELGRYPVKLPDLAAFAASHGIREPERLLLDPWGERYLYRLDESGKPTVYSVERVE